MIVVGVTCAGKTTFGRIASHNVPGIRVIEASDVVRSYRRRKDDALTSAQFAHHLLSESGPAIVAETIVSRYRLNEPGDVIITGFRTIQELEVLRQARSDAKVVLIEASDRTRYARYLRRGRDPAMSYAEFLAVDRAQWAFGLLQVAEDFADAKIFNEGSIPDYEKQIVEILVNPESPAAAGISTQVAPRHKLSVHRLFRCLSILEDFGKPMRCDEIEEITLRKERLESGSYQGPDVRPRYLGKRITQNNVNKVLKSAPELATRIDCGPRRVQYEITETGRAYLRLMRRLSEIDRNSK